MKENISIGIAVLAIVISIVAVASTVIVKPVAIIGAGAIGENELADNSVTSSKIKDGSVAQADLSSAVIDMITGVVDIANNSITGAKIADGTITNVDISNSADIDPSKILGTAWTATNDGSGSGLDADTLDGINSGEFVRNDSGTANYIPKFTGSATIGNSTIYETAGGNVGIGTTSPGYKLDVAGSVNAQQLCIAGSCKSSWPSIISSVDGVVNDEGDIDLIQSDSITITPNDVANTITIGESHSARLNNPHMVTAYQVGALVSVDGVDNPGGDVDLVAGSGISIIPDSNANRITIASTGVIGDIIFQKNGKELWRVFEDENGLYLESLETGEVYRFVLEEIEDTETLNQKIEDLQAENKVLESRITALEALLQ